ncbi:MAG: hypothetical protein LUQ41_00050 [Methanomicrobiales archaeon]|nr:hypothetical protein [Methanomicrobiales archaeon]
MRRVDIRDIPGEMRWQIATRLVSSFPVLYDGAFREAMGDRYDELEYNVWIEAGKEARAVADGFGFPTGTAKEIAECVRVVTTLFFGLDVREEVLDISGTRAVILTKGCPFMVRGAELGGRPAHLFPKCMAFSMAAVESLNPKYTTRFVRAMCMGDYRNCELTILTQEEAEKEDKKQ